MPVLFSGQNPPSIATGLRGRLQVLLLIQSAGKMEYLRRFYSLTLFIFLSVAVKASVFEMSCGHKSDQVISEIGPYTKGLRRIHVFTYKTERCMQTQTLIEVTPNCLDRVWCVDPCTGCKDGDTFYEFLSYYTGQHNPSWYQ